jgi:hypothetical protein
MIVVNSLLYNDLIKHHTFEVGETYFFENFTLMEIYEGVNLTFENLHEFFKLIKKYYGKNNPFGIIANRINSYSLNILDIEKFENKLKNLSAFAVVTYSNSSMKGLDYENNFFKIDRKHFNSILDAKNWMNKEVFTN